MIQNECDPPDGLAAFDLERGQIFLRKQINDVAISENILHSYRALSMVSINSTWWLRIKKQATVYHLLL